MTRKFEVTVARTVHVEIDETKFTEEFLKEFNNYISSSIEDIDGHIEHLALAFAAGRVDNDQFIEGYGPTKDFGIKFKEIGDEVDWVVEILK